MDLETQAVAVAVAIAVPLLLLVALRLLNTYMIKRKRAKPLPLPLPLPPGPTGWPVLGCLGLLNSLGPPHAALQALAEKHGALMHLRLGTTPTVVVSSPAMAEQFMRSHDLNFCNRPGATTAAALHMAYGLRDMVWAPHGPRWRMLRRLCVTRLFSASALAQFQPLRRAEVAALLRSIRRRDGDDATEVELSGALNACAANVLGQIVMGKAVFPDAGVAHDDAAEFRELVAALMKLAGAFLIGDFVPWLRWFDPAALVPQMKRVHRRLDAFLQRIVDAHAQAEGDDFLGLLLSITHAPADDDERKEQVPLSITEKKALLMDLFTAGTDTTASTTEWAMAELMRNPELMRRLKAEIDGVVGRERLVSEDDLGDMPLLRAVVKETLRIHPPTPLLLPREAAEEVEIGGYRIPKGARVLINAWAIQRDPAVWPDPMRFLPERFLNTGADVKGGDFRVIPFGAGRRICVGISLAMRSVEFMLASLVHAFDWSFADPELCRRPETLDMEEAFGLTLQRQQPLRAVATPRLPAEVY